ncbi:DUF1643 domain-containing protein [Virgibacillus xinjiangensis]|uniref:DUF1643 domain-containing protein n=1 Tax=Virgibacillus xinjiangensis TaxID=393090 RepID=A0ABV7CW48_9BACI
MLKPGHRYWRDDEIVAVEFDNDQDPTYRYALECIWDEKGKIVAFFIMLNPSVGNYDVCDPTLNRCVNFARSWGYGGIVVVNLFAYITSDPKELLEVEDPIGSRNDEVIDVIAEAADQIVYAWGVDHGHYHQRNQQVMERLKDYEPKCILKNKGGHPRHPLFLKKDLELMAF